MVKNEALKSEYIGLNSDVMEVKPGNSALALTAGLMNEGGKVIGTGVV